MLMVYCIIAAFLVGAIGINIVNVLNTMLEGVANLFVSAINVKIAKMSDALEEDKSNESTQVIGFTIPSDEEEDDNDD